MPGLNYVLTVPPTVEPVSLSLAKKQLRIDIPDDNYLIETYISVAREWCESFTNRAFYPQTWTLYLDSFPYGDYRETVPLDQRSPWNYSAYWNDFAIRLPKPMCLSVEAINYIASDLSPQVLDPSLYYVDYNSRPCRITPVAGGIWPLTQFYQPGSINIPYIAGSYTTTIANENVSLALSAGADSPVIGTLKHQLLSIVSIKDTNGGTLTSTTDALKLDDNGDPMSLTQLTFDTAPPGNVAVVTYKAGILPKPILMAMLLIIGHLYEHREENSEITLKTVPMGVEQMLRRYKFDIMGNYRSGY